MNKQVYSRLSKSEEGTYLSIYIPTEVAGDYQKNRIIFKNAVEKARSKIEVDLPEVNPYKYLSKAEEVLNDPDFWANQSSTLGYFSDGKEAYFAHLPVSSDPMIYLGSKYITFPFQQVFDQRQRYFVLYLDLNGIQFFEGNAYAITPVVIADVAPTRITDIEMMYQKNNDLQHNPNNASYHGHEDNAKEKYRDEFFRTLDKGLMTFLHDEDCPLILVGLEENVHHYHKLSKYSNIVSEHLIGQWKPLNLDDLQVRTWTKIQSSVERNRLDKEAIGQLESQNLVERDISGIKTKLSQGQIDQLVFPQKDHPSIQDLEPIEVENLCRSAQATSVDISWDSAEADDIIGILRYNQ